MVRQLSKKYKTDRYCKRFRTYDHLVTMLYSSFHRCSSLREVITGMQASATRLQHLGLSYTPRRSTLSDANERRTAEFFEELYHEIYKLYYGGLPDSLKRKRELDKLFIIDSTVITLFSTVMKSTGAYGCNGKKKGGIKAHVLYRVKDSLPCFVKLTEGKMSDPSFLRYLKLPAGSIVVFDKGYRNFKQFMQWTKEKITWVTRMHRSSVYKIIESRPLTSEQQKAGVQQDLIIELGNPETAYINPIQKVRLVCFLDQVTDRQFQFVSNNLEMDALTVTDIYKRRWDIEIFFKRIKQNFQLHSFLGDNDNAIRIQVWCSLIADLLLTIIKDKATKKRKWSMANLAGLVRLHLGTYVNLYEFLSNPEKALIHYRDPVSSIQHNLFTIDQRGLRNEK